MPRRLLRRLQALVRRRRCVEDELDEELQFHIAMETEANVAGGLKADEARRVALRDFGGLTQTRESVREVRASFIDALSRNLRQVGRSLVRNPGYALAVTVVLGIGIASSTAVYSIARALLFRPIPYSDPSSLYLISTAYSTGGAAVASSPTIHHWEFFEELEKRPRSLDAVAACSSRGANLRGDGWSERLQVDRISNGFLPITGVRALRGRGFLASDFDPGHSHVALLAFSLWQRRFGGSSDAVGRTIVLNEVPYSIVGVLPPDFRSVDELETGIPTWYDRRLGVLVPLVADPTLRSSTDSSAAHSLRVLVRLRQEAMLANAREDMAFLSRRLVWPPGPMKSSYTLVPLSSALSPDVSVRLALLAAGPSVPT